MAADTENLAGNDIPSRLEPIMDSTPEPFVRAQEIKDCSLYWMPVTSFPVYHAERQWLLEFHQRLAKHLASEYELREELFLHFKVLYPDVIDRFTERA